LFIVIFIVVLHSWCQSKISACCREFCTWSRNKKRADPSALSGKGQFRNNFSTLHASLTRNL